MFKTLILILIFIVSVSAQSWTQGQDVSTDNGNHFAASNTDSVFWDDDTLYICGAETAYVFINVGKSLGMLTYKAVVTTKDTMNHASDSARVVFELALLKGMSYTALDANATETYYGMDSTDVANAAVDLIYIRPFDNTNLDKKNTNYYLMRIRGRFSTNISAILIREERLRAY